MRKKLLITPFLFVVFFSYGQTYNSLILLGKTIPEIKSAMKENTKYELLGESKEIQKDDPTITYINKGELLAYYIDLKSNKCNQVAHLVPTFISPAIIDYFDKFYLKITDNIYIDKTKTYKYELNMGDNELMGIISSFL